MTSQVPAAMGSSGSKKLPKEDMDFLMENTNFTKQQIKAWYSGFMVRTQLYSFVSTPVIIIIIITWIFKVA